MNVKIWVYQHFDSRGGTTGVVAQNEAEAELKYFKVFKFSESQTWEEYAKECSIDQSLHEFLEPELLGEFELELAELPEADEELEHHDNYVLQHRTEKRLKVVHSEHDFGIDGEPEAEFGEEPDFPGHENWIHPRWDDDAYNFILMI